MTLNCCLSRHPHQQVPQEHRTERAFGHEGTCGEGRASAVGPPSLQRSAQLRTRPVPFMVVCLWPHSNNGGRRSCGSSRSESSAGTTRSRCAGRRRGGARSTSRYRGARERTDGPSGSSSTGRPSLGCGSPSLRTAQLKPVFTLSQAAILTYSRSQTHSLGSAHSLSLASCPGQSPLTCLDLWVLPTLGIYFEGSAEA